MPKLHTREELEGLLSSPDSTNKAEQILDAIASHIKAALAKEPDLKKDNSELDPINKARSTKQESVAHFIVRDWPVKDHPLSELYLTALGFLDSENLNQARSEDGKTPIFVAIDSGNYDVVPHLVELGANLEAKNSEGKNAVSYWMDKIRSDFGADLKKELRKIKNNPAGRYKGLGESLRIIKKITLGTNLLSKEDEKIIKEAEASPNAAVGKNPNSLGAMTRKLAAESHNQNCK